MFGTINAQIKSVGWDFDASKLTLDGQKHDLRIETFKGQYVGSVYRGSGGLSCISLTAWEWRTSKKRTFKTDYESLSKKELAEFHRRAQEDQEKLNAAKKELHLEIADRCTLKWDRLNSDSSSHPYLTNKGLDELLPKEEGTVLGAKIVRDTSTDQVNLIIPMRDVNGKLWGLQTIDAEGNKTFTDGQRTSGLFHIIGKLDPRTVVYVVEGFATGATIHGCTGKTTIVAYSAQNLAEVGKALRLSYPNLRIVFSGDHDRWKRDQSGVLYLTGLRASRKAAHEAQGSVCLPSFEDCDAQMVQKEKPTDFNDLLLLSSRQTVETQIRNHYETTPLEFIETEHTGFHRSVVVRGGIKYEPVKEDMLTFWSRGKIYRMLEESKICYQWNGKYYREVNDQELEWFAQKHYDKDLKECCDIQMAREFKGVVHRSDHTPVEWFYDTTRGLLSLQNGVLDLRTGVFSKHSPKHGFRGCVSYNYLPEAKSPTFDAMMKRITKNDQELEDMLLEYAGYCISNDDTWLQTALICVGSGANGKSTFLNVVRGLCGSDNTSSLTIGELGHEYNRIRLDGKLCNLAEENSQKRIENEAFKNLVTGGQTSGRHPYKNSVEFRNRAKFILAFNEFDRSIDSSDGFVRRLLIAPFDAIFKRGAGEYDPHIEEKLQKELPGIFNRAWKAYQACKDRGYITEPKSVKEAREELKLASNPVAMYMDEFLHVNGSKDTYVVVRDVHKHYVEWCRECQYLPTSLIVFSRKLREVLRQKSVPDLARERIRRNGATLDVIRYLGWNDGIQH